MIAFHSDYFGRRRIAALCVLLLCLFAVASGSSLAANASSSPLPAKPYRVLLVVDEWSDPSSLVVAGQKDTFQPVAALLKAWSVPFDILRLDQQHLDATYLLSRSGKVRYGAVIWLADAPAYDEQDLASLEQAAQAGTGLIVAHSRFLDPTLNKLLGLKFNQLYGSTDAFRVAHDHYITRDDSIKKNPPPQTNQFSDRVWVTPATADVLMTQGEHPIVTVNQLSPNASAVWLGSPTVALLAESAFWRNLLFRSLVWNLGYVVVPDMDYSHRIIFELDDWGTADKGFLNYWHYLEPDQETIRKYLIGPLKQHHGSASAMVDSGYIDRQSKRVVSPWTQQFTDAFGLQQDFASTSAGLKEGMAEGVLDIESHGWTHMQPDLLSSPGPWWTADVTGAGSLDGWYVEFQDRRRDKDVPAVAQMYHMKRSQAELQQDFGVQALELKPGGDAWSRSQFNNTAQLASRVGFGLFHGDAMTYYLDHQLVLDMASVVPDFDTLVGGLHPERWPAHPDGPLFLGFHDRDISLHHSFMDQLFAALPAGYHTMGANQYIGILHTAVDSTSGDDGLQLTFTQDKDFCAYFDKHDSAWQLWLADPVRERLAATHPEVVLDGKPVRFTSADFQRETLAIDLPPGLATHTWRLNSRSSAVSK